MGIKHALVTGAAGFVGGACARELLARGWRVTALVHRRMPQGLEGAELVRGPVTDSERLAPALAGAGPFDAVVHAAGRAADVGPRREFRRVNFLGVVNVIECMRRVGIERLVHISTTDVYGLRDFHNAGENTPFADNLRNPYPKYKILAERAVRDMLPPARYAILRPGIVWGPGDRTILPRVLAFLRASPFLLHFGRWRGHSRFPLAHVENVARAAFLAAGCDDCAGQAYNVVDPEHTTIDEYYRMVLDACLPDTPARKSLTLPFVLGWAVGQLSTAVSNALGRDRPLFDPTLYGLYTVSCNLDFSSDKLQRLFARHGEEFVDRRSAWTHLRTHLRCVADSCGGPDDVWASCDRPCL